jgi:hypothetical protein
MSAFKRFDKQDAYVTTYISHKKWEVRGDEFENLAIVVQADLQGDNLKQIQHQYYPQRISTQTQSTINGQQLLQITEVPLNFNDYYYQSTLLNPDSRNLSPGAFEITIPPSLYGININPGASLALTIENVQQLLYVDVQYWEEDYTNDPITVTQLTDLQILDDGEGGLYVVEQQQKQYVGDIIYTHGKIIITHPTYSALLNQGWNSGLSQNGSNNSSTRSNFKLNWESSLPIFTYNYNCKLREFEYNYTTNPTTQQKQLQQVVNSDNTIEDTYTTITQGVLKSQFINEQFSPYITTVGLYNDTNQLIAIGKLSTPVPKSQQTEMTITVKLDI